MYNILRQIIENGFARCKNHNYLETQRKKSSNQIWINEYEINENSMCVWCVSVDEAENRVDL